MAQSTLRRTTTYVRPEPTHWFWTEDVPSGKSALSVEECARLAIQPHENRLATNDVPAVLFSQTYYLLDAR